MTATCSFDIPIVSANARLMNPRHVHRFVSRERYRACKEALTLLFRSQIKYRAIEKCTVSIEFATDQWTGDLDNGTKVVLDALVYSGVLKDDRFIEELHLSRISSESGITASRLTIQII